jgi:drug/metabolite transporter (DMT)-like permease
LTSTTRLTARESRFFSSPNASGIALAVVAAIAFGTLAISAKFAYRVGAAPIPLLAVRFAIAAIMLAVYHVVIRRPLTVPRAVFGRLVVGGGLLYGIEATLFFAALERAPAAVVSLVFYSYPLWTTLLGFVTGLEAFRWQLLAALGLGGAGVLLIFSLPTTGIAGPLLATAAALFVALYFIFMQFALRDASGAVAAMWTSAGAALVLGIASAITQQGIPAAALGPAVALAAASAFAFATLNEAIRRIGSARSSIAAMLEPVTTLILAAALLGEELSLRILIGAALIVSVLPLLATAGHREGTAPAADSL